ncbi:MAG: DUF481 domain-containing protein [Acidobacteriota bacterium]|nr:DUF481 domain-containing protein [Acidobacteriota bacterium]
MNTLAKRLQHRFRLAGGLAFAVMTASALSTASAQSPIVPKPTADVVVFSNGDQLTGTLVSGSGNSIVFKSDMAGEINISLDKVKELHTSGTFAVLRRDQPIKKTAQARAIVPATISYSDAILTVDRPAAPEIIPEAQIANIVDQASFTKEINHGNFFRGWNGAINGGATVVRSTDYGETLTAGIALVRTAPSVTFLPARDRTLLDLQETYGKLTSPVVPQTTPPSPAAVTKTSILHADAERDEYFSARFFALAQTAFDHNYSQGLNLQQIYGGGIGYTPIKDDRQELDLKATVQYEKQSFKAPANNVNLIGSTVSETYHRALPRKFVFSEFGNFIPAFNHLSDYSANVSGTLTLPVYKRLGVSFTATDNYLNNPSAGYNKNSSQFVAAASYSLR